MSDEKTDDSRNYSETVGTRLTPQTKRQFDEYREANEIGKTEAARRLIRDSLDDTDETLNTLNKTALVVGAAYAGVVLFAGLEAASMVGAAYITVLLLWSSSHLLNQYR